MYLRLLQIDRKDDSALLHLDQTNSAGSSQSSPQGSSQDSSQGSSQGSSSSSQQQPSELDLLRLRTGRGNRSSLRPSLYNGDERICSDLKTKLLDFSLEPKVAVTSERFDVLSFWYSRRFEYPELFRLSEVALAAPSTEVEVERLFSALVLVLTHLRNRLSRETLNALLMLKMNMDLIKSIDFSDFK